MFILMEFRAFFIIRIIVFFRLGLFVYNFFFFEDVGIIS